MGEIFWEETWFSLVVFIGNDKQLIGQNVFESFLTEVIHHNTVDVTSIVKGVTKQIWDPWEEAADEKAQEYEEESDDPFFRSSPIIFRLGCFHLRETLFKMIFTLLLKGLLAAAEVVVKNINFLQKICDPSKFSFSLMF